MSDQWVRLRVRVRRFFCDTPACPQRTFAERLPDLVPVRAQRTGRLTQALEVLGLALGGRAGARVADRLWLPSCRHTVLRIVRRADLPQRHPAQILGVDDFTFHKGHVYGTILVDLEQHRPVDLLLDRDAELLEGWLVAHPGVTIVSRDRSTEYIRGITASTPRAPQVADRWHLLSNLREALERMLDRLHSQLRARVHMPTNQAGDQHVPVVRMRRRSTNEETARTARPTLDTLPGSPGAL